MSKRFLIRGVKTPVLGKNKKTGREKRKRADRRRAAGRSTTPSEVRKLLAARKKKWS